MRRALAPLLAALLLLLTAVPTLAGGKPEFARNEPLPPEFYPAGVVCTFDLRIDYVVDTGHSITFPEAPDGSVRSLLGGHLVVTVTNEETNQSVTYNISGPGKFLFSGDVLTITGGGPWLLYGFPGDAGGPGMWFTKGPIVLEVDLNTGAWLSASKPGNIVDVCALLGGASAPDL
jgi:hypothetical protein